MVISPDFQGAAPIADGRIEPLVPDAFHLDGGVIVVPTP
jgi:hypothetical protein